jgi:hsp70-interacting protein
MSADASIPGMPNWLGLLKWSLAYSDGTNETSNHASKEDMEWLANAMADLVQDQPKRIKEILNELVKFMENPTIDNDSIVDSNDTDKNKEKTIDVIELLEEVRDIIDQVDMAQIFVKYGGIKCLMYFITTEIITLSVRSLAAVILAEISQNNLNVQEEANKINIIPELCTQCLQANNFNFAAKLLFAISSIVRNNSEAEIIFRDSQMAPIFTKGIESGDIPFMRRTLFFINYFVSNSSKIRTQLDDCLIPNIYSLIYVDDVDIREETLKLLLILSTTQVEWKNKITIHKEEFQQAINMRSSLNDINSEQDNFEKGLIQEIFTAIDTTVFTTRGGNSTNNNNIDSNAQQQQQQTPILLIEPAGLAAAHLRP